MNLRLLPAVLLLAAAPLLAQTDAGPSSQPPGVDQALAQLTAQPATHTAFTLDRNTLAAAGQFLDGGGGPPAQLDSITFVTYHYHQPAFYIPEEMKALRDAYADAGWNHLVDAHPKPRDAASPQKPLTDLWLHLNDMKVDHLTVLLRGTHEMTVIEVSGELRPIDLLHLGGHFGIPKVDPNAVMVPAPPGK